MGLNNTNLPKHIAIIMDGNGRWSKKYAMPKKFGHKKGAEVAKQIALHCAKIGVKFLTLYTFSSENWNRPENEISDLMSLFKEYLQGDVQELIRNDVSVKFIGKLERFDKDLRDLMNNIEVKSSDNSFKLILALGYGARDELRDAFSAMLKDYQDGNQLNDISQYLYTKDIPDPDLLIRTSGEKRISNFLLWQIAYTELYFTNKLWPEFDTHELDEAIKDFSLRERRYGA